MTPVTGRVAAHVRALDTGVMAALPLSDAAEEPGRTVAAVARRLGVAPATLRTWDRRYGLGPSAHAAGSHRRYTAADVERLAEMRRLTLEGVPPGEAARHALATHGATLSTNGATSAPHAVGTEQAGAERHDDAHHQAGGGTVLAMPGASADVRGLARAAMALDDRSCTALVRESLHRHGVVETWQHLVSPVLVSVGARWEATGFGVDVEHLLSESVLVAMRTSTPPAEPRNASPVLLASAEEDQHGLVLHVLRAALAERQVSARVLGSRVPRDALASAVRRSGPSAVFLWSQMQHTGDPEQLEALPRIRPAPGIVVGGPGWAHAQLPPSVHAVDSLDSALDMLTMLSCPGAEEDRRR